MAQSGGNTGNPVYNMAPLGNHAYVSELTCKRKTRGKTLGACLLHVDNKLF